MVVVVVAVVAVVAAVAAAAVAATAVASGRCTPRCAPSVELTPRYPSCPGATSRFTAVIASVP